MERVVLEGVSAEEIPAAWRGKLGPVPERRYRVIIEVESAASGSVGAREAAIFGMWSDRADLKGPTAWLDAQRAGRERPDRKA